MLPLCGSCSRATCSDHDRELAPRRSLPRSLPFAITFARLQAALAEVRWGPTLRSALSLAQAPHRRLPPERHPAWMRALAVTLALTVMVTFTASVAIPFFD